MYIYILHIFYIIYYLFFKRFLFGCEGERYLVFLLGGSGCNSGRCTDSGAAELSSRAGMLEQPSFSNKNMSLLQAFPSRWR